MYIMYIACIILNCLHFTFYILFYIFSACLIFDPCYLSIYIYTFYSMTSNVGSKVRISLYRETSFLTVHMTIKL